VENATGGGGGGRVGVGVGLRETMHKRGNVRIFSTKNMSPSAFPRIVRMCAGGVGWRISLDS
jgi:hypothetical protein